MSLFLLSRFKMPTFRVSLTFKMQSFFLSNIVTSHQRRTFHQSDLSFLLSSLNVRLYASDFFLTSFFLLFFPHRIDIHDVELTTHKKKIATIVAREIFSRRISRWAKLPAFRIGKLVFPNLKVMSCERCPMRNPRSQLADRLNNKL